MKIIEIVDLPDGTYATILEEGGFKVLLISESNPPHQGLAQGRIHIGSKGGGLPSPYMSTMLTGLMWHSRPAKVAVLGLGTGGIPNFLRNAFLDTEIHIVEHFQEIIEIARKYFRVEQPGNYIYHQQDYLKWLNRTRRVDLDLLIVDVFTYEPLTGQMANPEFFRLCKSRLRPDGVLTVNLFGDPDQVNLCFQVAATEFSSLYRIPNEGNEVLVATNSVRSPEGIQQHCYSDVPDLFDNIPLEKLKALYDCLEVYLTTHVGVRPEDNDELLPLWDAFYECDDYIRQSYDLD